MPAFRPDLGIALARQRHVFDKVELPGGARVASRQPLQTRLRALPIRVASNAVGKEGNVDILGGQLAKLARAPEIVP